MNLHSWSSSSVVVLIQDTITQVASYFVPHTGNFPPVVSIPSPAATSVTITWTQPEFSRTVTGYTVTVTLGDNEGMCYNVEEDDRVATTEPGVTTTMITGLEEFRNYRVTVTATLSPGFGFSSPYMIVSNPVNFTSDMASECL